MGERGSQRGYKIIRETIVKNSFVVFFFFSFCSIFFSPPHLLHLSPSFSPSLSHIRVKQTAIKFEEKVYNETLSNYNRYPHTHIHTYTHTHIHIHTYIHTHIHTYTYTHTHIHTYTHTHIHTYTHTHIHTYTHTHTRANCLFCLFFLSLLSFPSFLSLFSYPFFLSLFLSLFLFLFFPFLSFFSFFSFSFFFFLVVGDVMVLHRVTVLGLNMRRHLLWLSFIFIILSYY